MEEYNADFSPAKLDWILRIAASGKVQDFAHRLELKCAEISENKRLAFLESEQTTALNDPDFDLHLNQREHRQEFLKIFADNENTWQVHHDTSTIEAFLSHFPFLQNMVNEMIAAEKVQVINLIRDLKIIVVELESLIGMNIEIALDQINRGTSAK